MCRWRKRKGSTVLTAILLAIALLAGAPVTRSLQAGPITDPPVPVQDNNSDTANDSLASAGQLPPAQQTGAQQPAAPAPSSTNSDTDNKKKRLGVNPLTGLTVSSASDFTPLTGEERWNLYWRQNFLSVGAYFRPVFFALVIDQTTNSPSQWGGGFRGFGLRVGSRTLSNIVQGTIRAPLAAVLHEDVRYISDQRGGKRRLVHAVKYSFLTYNNQGHPTLNIAKLVAYYASTAISTTWRPGRQHVLGYTFSNGSEQMGLAVPINILQEFWPEIRRKLVRWAGGHGSTALFDY